MGRDKLTLEVGDQPLVERVYRVLAPRCGEVLVVGMPSAAVADDLLPGARRVSDLRPGRKGPLAGIEAGLAAARYDRVFVAAGDMPFIPGHLVDFLLDLVSCPNVLAAVPRYGGRLHPLCAAYDRALLPALRAVFDRGVRAVHEFLAQPEGVRLLENLGGFGDPEVFLMNVNTPADLRRARAALCGPHRE